MDVRRGETRDIETILKSSYQHELSDNVLGTGTLEGRQDNGSPDAVRQPAVG